MTAHTRPSDLVQARVKSFTDDEVVLAIPGTDYQLHLVPTMSPREMGLEVGKRARGIIRGRALRIHPAEGGGRFIEPVWGAPRIVAGRVLDVNAELRTVLVDVAVPMWYAVPEEQDWSVLQEGRLVNMYVESGTTFETA